MTLLLQALILLIAALHLWFLVLEVFLWQRPLGLRVFHQNAEQAQATARLALNQGVYNGFLSAGLVWSALAEAALQRPLQLFFLLCVVVAGLVGAWSVSKRIFWIQAFPALLGLVLLWAVPLQNGP